MAHPHLSESEKEELCRVRTARSSPRRPAPTQRRTSASRSASSCRSSSSSSSSAECLMVSEPLEGGGSRQLGLPISGEHHCAGWPLAARENQILREGMDSMKQRVAELEKECSTMKGQIERLGCSRSAGKSWFQFPLAVKPQICSTKEAALETAAAASEDKLAVVKAGTGTGTGSGGTPQLMHSPSPRLFF